jgi:hypothetical protein
MFIECHVANPVGTVLDVPMASGQGEKMHGIGAFDGQAADTIDGLLAKLACLQDHRFVFQD